MRFSITAVLALASSLVQAQYDPTPGFHPITKPTQGEEVAAGSTYEIVWEPSASYPGTITIGLLGGDSPSTLDNLPPIASKTCPCPWLKRTNPDRFCNNRWRRRLPGLVQLGGPRHSRR
jgi:hypothetical protein